MSNVPNLYTTHMLHHLTCVQGHIKQRTGGQQSEAMRASIGEPAETSMPVCSLRLFGKPIKEKEGQHAVAVQRPE